MPGRLSDQKIILNCFHVIIRMLMKKSLQNLAKDDNFILFSNKMTDETCLLFVSSIQISLEKRNSIIWRFSVHPTEESFQIKV